MIRSRLKVLQDASSPITLVTVRGIFVATIVDMAPEVFEKVARDGSVFHCSDSYLRRWLHETMRWMLRRATRAAQKLPINWEDICEKSVFRLVHDIKDLDVPPELYVNSDQTQVTYSQGSGMTYAPIGAKQVSVVGEEEKRAFTAMTSASNSGVLLPFQAVYMGKSTRSCPNKSANSYNEADRAGFRFEFSGTGTYWSNQKTMRSFVNDILVPYFTEQKKKLGLPSSQKCIWQIDAWVVHRSKDFHDWMKTNHSDIILHYVPAGCTGVFQVCDVGIQRIFKHSLKRSYHVDVVADILGQVKAKVTRVEIDKCVEVWRDRSVRWLWNAYNTLNEEKTVKKAFEMCQTKEWNLSYNCLTGFATCERLRNLKADDPEFYDELMANCIPKETTEYPEDDEMLTKDEEGDDSDLPIAMVVAHAVDLDVAAAVVETADGNLASNTLADGFDNDNIEFMGETEEVDPIAFERASGKRKVRKNPLYSSDAFWRH
jgi:hypothetical protein